MGIYEQEWKDYETRYKNLMTWGTYVGLVQIFDDSLFTQARDLYYNNVPAVLLLLENNLVQKHCYDRAKLLAYILNDPEAEVVVANIEGLKYNPLCLGKYLVGKLGDNYAEHCFVRRKEKDGRVWIYDTSLGLKVEEGLYKDIQKPEILSKSKKPIKLDEIGIKKYTREDLNENKDYIRSIISAYIDDLNPISKDYRDLMKKELKVIENGLPDDKEVQYGK